MSARTTAMATDRLKSTLPAISVANPMARAEVYFLAAVPTPLVTILHAILPPITVAVVVRFADSPRPPHLTMRVRRIVSPMGVTALTPIRPLVISIIQGLVHQVAHRCASENLSQVPTGLCYLAEPTVSAKTATRQTATLLYAVAPIMVLSPPFTKIDLLRWSRYRLIDAWNSPKAHFQLSIVVLAHRTLQVGTGIPLRVKSPTWPAARCTWSMAFVLATSPGEDITTDAFQAKVAKVDEMRRKVPAAIPYGSRMRSPAFSTT